MGRPIEEQLKDEIEDQFVFDSDVESALRNFARFRSRVPAHRREAFKAELADRLDFLLTKATERAEELILGPNEPDDPEARPGTWERVSA